jgi:hypothetical protein
MGKVVAAMAGFSGSMAISTTTLSSAAQRDHQIACGKYPVEPVAMGIDCHSSRKENGEFDRAKWLQGWLLLVKPAGPIPDWADDALPIAGRPLLSEADAMKRLEAGRLPSGKLPRPPMPAYRMTHGEAAAVVAYLKSWKLTSPWIDHRRWSRAFERTKDQGGGRIPLKNDSEPGTPSSELIAHSRRLPCASPSEPIMRDFQ